MISESISRLKQALTDEYNRGNVTVAARDRLMLALADVGLAAFDFIQDRTPEPVCICIIQSSTDGRPYPHAQTTVTRRTIPECPVHGESA